jgi:hypothetical protein
VITATPLSPTTTPWVITATPAQPNVIPATTPPVTFTVTSASTPTATSRVFYEAPVLTDPSNGSRISDRTVVLRWRSTADLLPGEVFEVSISPENSTETPIIEWTINKSLPLDFTKWKFQTSSGKFLWTVRIRIRGDLYLSPVSGLFSFVLAEPTPARTPGRDEPHDRDKPPEVPPQKPPYP